MQMENVVTIICEFTYIVQPNTNIDNSYKTKYVHMAWTKCSCIKVGTFTEPELSQL